MSETLLKIIIRLFAIVAKEDDVTEDERAVMQEFLLDHGFLDLVVARDELKDTLARCLRHLT